jgi:sialic acid synthase SpsE
MALGAKLVERHFTDTFDRKGPDIICSMDEYALKDLLVASEEISQMIGGRKEPVKEEQVTIDFAFATVVTIADVKKGEEFNKSNLWVKRPGIGEIHADKYEKILGCIANCDILKDTHLKCEMIRDYEK